jgi:hypothetical protein
MREYAVRLLRGTRTLPPPATGIVGHRLIGAQSRQRCRSVDEIGFHLFPPFAVNVPVTVVRGRGGEGVV